jgi:multiple sugar transport system permease protein
MKRLEWPYLVGLVALVAIPGAGALALAFTEFTGVQSPRFVGIDNFTRLATDDRFWSSLGNSMIHVLLSTPLRMLAAVGLALLLARRSRGAGAARGIVYLPSVIPDAAYALLWFWFLNPLYGPVATALNAFGVTSPEWFTDPWAARIAMALLGAFQIGEGFIIALAARAHIAPSLYEAAAVDGASPWFTLRTVTLPIMAPVLALLALRDLILSFQVTLVPALLITDGGPRYATTYLPLYVYRTAFRYFRLGYASAITVTMFVLTALVIYVQYRLARRWRMV